MATSKSKSSTPAAPAAPAAPATPPKKRMEKVEVVGNADDAAALMKGQDSGEDAAAEQISAILASEGHTPLEGDNTLGDEWTGRGDRSGDEWGMTVDGAAAELVRMLEGAAPDDADGSNFEDDADSDDADSENEDSEDPEDNEDAEDSEDSENEDYYEFDEKELDLKVKLKNKNAPGGYEYRTLREVLADGMRAADYSRKTQELAEQRKEVERIRAESAEAAERFAASLQVIDQFVGTLSEPQKQGLRQLHEQARAHVEAVTAQAEYEKLVAENAKLKEALGWKTPDDVQKGKRELVAAAQEFGFEPDELKGVYDHRLLVLLHEAHQYRQLRDKGRKARDEVRGKRRNSPGLKPGTRGARGNSNKRAQAAARSRLRQTGRLDDAASIILGMDID